MEEIQKIETQSISLSGKFKAVTELTKARLNLSVVYSAMAGYLLGANAISGLTMLYLGIGGFLVVGAANGFNQIIERDRDLLMKRTMNRPLPTGRLSVLEAMIACTIMAFVGLYLLFLINPLTVGFGAFALFMYVLVYTPLKAVGPIAVFVGALPGAIPALLGWVAATNDFDIEPGVLFAMQFLWQFAHFWAIGWIADEEYKKAGYVLLPSRERDTRTATQIVLYTLFTIPVSLLPFFGITGSLSLSWVAALIILAAGIFFLIKAIKLFKTREIKDARALMFASIIYLPVVQLVYVIDKFI
ncbi:protoheme IX farnesyltransferase [Owenweeksia hongkongensis DSM 17368]|uniref:Protoheme IX farnesyltransferase n=1 Tax=Owenweeksia hongkongensis (strain DSM 17368 / CIP 108786 / JCM 12287 / NRRL B-23963 / UST20020801) TaxID=926562 RepID=G8R296_OWEHD|nr:heme o synthase [Owenweeksia hongkongensis]AEV32886.1 protoheme IX farnesyltransferase [Owenweeksia hongkongensis DSM 17368]